MTQTRKRSATDLAPSLKGAIAEYLAIIWLLKQGYACFKNVCPSGEIDFVAIKESEIIKIDVKSVMLGDKNTITGIHREMVEKKQFLGIKVLASFGDGTFMWGEDAIEKYVRDGMPLQVRRCFHCLSDYMSKTKKKKYCCYKCKLEAKYAKQGA